MRVPERSVARRLQGRCKRNARMQLSCRGRVGWIGVSDYQGLGGGRARRNMEGDTAVM